MKSLARWMIVVAMLVATMGMVGCDDGSDGAPGASAYDIAVANGFDGTEQDWLDSLEVTATQTNESCNVCHGEGQTIGLSIDSLHPLVDPKVEITNIVVASVAGVGDTVTFDANVEGLDSGDFRIYMADIVPALTATTNVPVATWYTDYTERWMYERDNGDPTAVPPVPSDYPWGALVEAPPGTYTYTFAADLAVGSLADAPEFDNTHFQRLLIRVGDTDDFTREAAIVDFVIPGDGLNTGILSQDEADLERAIVVQEACTNCHGDPLQSAAHGASYQTPQGCVVCHSPIGKTPQDVAGRGEPEVLEPLGDTMQESGYWLASLIHGIHSAGTLAGLPYEDGTDFSEVTYPQEIAECEKCHFDDGQVQALSWKENPTAEACATCHDVTFGPSPTHSGGSWTNANCSGCHPADGAITPPLTYPVSTVHAVDYDRDNLLYNVTIALSPVKAVYEVGDTILVTATTDFAGFDYTNADTDFLRGANLYVYGPRALAVPVLTPGSTTDPDYIDPEVTPPGTPPEQGVSMLASAKADDANVLTDASGFKYQLLEVTEDMADGTYMVQTNIDFSATGDRTTDGRHIGPRFYPLDGWELLTFQVGTADPEAKVAGECTGCHEQRNFSTYAHRSYFGTDGCLACHDQSGNHADPLTNRVHAVHAASTAGDLTNVPGEDPDRVWDEITFPRNLNASCAACHNSGTDSYRKNPNGSWGFACIGCHAGTEGARDHMEQNGAPFPVH